ncbi:MAG: hypothetical protein K1X89_18410 [Myxococcaceae bacterium]|nr:hypothetical protein [Myxococcaceae bacterium]
MRMLWLALGVLVPFGLLVALGLYLTSSGPAPLEVAEAPLPSPPVPAVAPARVVAVAPPAPQVVEPVAVAPAPPPPAPLPPPVEGPPDPPERSAQELDRIVVPKAVRAAAKQCLSDMADRVHEKITVSLQWSVNEVGAVQGVVAKSSWPDPQLEACIEDAFRDGPTFPGATPNRRTRTRLIFDPSARDAGE